MTGRPVVFVGPSLDQANVAAFVDADVQGPAAKGDLARAVAQGSPAILLIDGVYERTPAVGHKEILWALEQGVAVYGASSMGALRAAELDTFGMIGVGSVYEQLRDASIVGDDEVAVAHLSAEYGYRAVSVALVDVTATLAAARRAGVIDAVGDDALLRASKVLFYAQRSWPTILDAARASGLGGDRVERFRAWLPSGQRSQKADDARAALSRLAADLERRTAHPSRQWRLARTEHWQQMEGRLGLRFARGADLLHDSIADGLRIEGSYVEVYQAAMVRVLASALARLTCKALPNGPAAVALLRRHLDLDDDAALDRWVDDNHFDDVGLERFAVDQAALVWAHGSAGEDAERAIPDVLRLRGHLADLVSGAASVQRRLQDAGIEQLDLDVLGLTEAELWHWHFGHEPVPEDLAAHARWLGFADVSAMRRAVTRNWYYEHATGP